MQELRIFDNQEFGSIRTIEENGQIWFCGKDVAAALGYTNSKKSINDHCKEDGVTIHSLIDSMGRTQQAKFINEPNLYRLITHSKLPSAERFEKWVFEEVLPAIRKTGKYEMPEAKQRGLTKDDYIRAASIVAGCRNERMPYVLSFLGQAGINIPEVEKQEMEQQKEDSDLVQLSRMIGESNLSLRKISELTNIALGSLSAYLNCKSRPSPERYQILIQVLSKT